ncbi:unnamed protein product [Cyclocybe aegerita]|uniref:Zn(2)-C6 fungal-type domain-containing protein n=1 Tax=Cyclocybe aegerita TaxID=1973307 RepID=A0A8S0W5S7_CYCAE|nr:unnamed protein product [Cyclocybe aegerita]
MDFQDDDFALSAASERDNLAYGPSGIRDTHSTEDTSRQGWLTDTSDFSQRANSESPSFPSTPSAQQTPTSTPPQATLELHIVKPTIPSVRQRTAQACDKCRERKTKCSGHRPVCVRCTNRGLICQYSTREMSRIRGPIKPRTPIPLNRISPHDPLDAYFPGQGRPTPALHSRMGGCRTDAFVRPSGPSPLTLGALGQRHVSRSLQQVPTSWNEPAQPGLSELYSSTPGQQLPDKGDLDLSLNYGYTLPSQSIYRPTADPQHLASAADLHRPYLPVPEFSLQMSSFVPSGPSLRVQTFDGDRDFSSIASSSGMSTLPEQLVPHGLPSYSQDTLPFNAPYTRALPATMGAYWDINAEFENIADQLDVGETTTNYLVFDSPDSGFELELDVACPAPIVPFFADFLEDVKMGHRTSGQHARFSVLSRAFGFP